MAQVTLPTIAAQITTVQSTETKILAAVTALQVAVGDLRADVDGKFAQIIGAEAAEGQGGGSPPPPTPAVTRYPATGPDAAFMPPVPPASTPSAATAAISGTIAAGVFHNVVDVPAGGSVTGAGSGKTILDITGLRPLYQKGVVVVEGPGGGTVSGMTLTGAAIDAASGENASGICNGAAGYDMVLRDVECYGNNEGARNLGGSITGTGCYFHHNGADSQNTGDTHNSYFNPSTKAGGGDASVVSFTDSKWEAALFAHELKTRLSALVLSNCQLLSRVIAGSNGTYITGGATQLGGNGNCLNLPNGGSYKGRGVRYYKGPGCANRVFITYIDAGDGGLWSGYSGVAYDDSPVFDNETGQQCYVNVGPGGTYTINNPTYKGGDPVFNGNVIVTGTVTRI